MLIIPNSFSKKLNHFLARDLVNKSANCNSITINLISQDPLAICSRRK